MKISEGDVVEVHPASDWWMRGVRYGTVLDVRRKYVYIQANTGHRIKLRKDLELLEKD